MSQARTGMWAVVSLVAVSVLAAMLGWSTGGSRTARGDKPAGEWHTLGSVRHGDRHEGYRNDKKLLQGEDDLFKEPGGVGLWTKADAVTSFDDFTVRRAGR